MVRRDDEPNVGRSGSSTGRPRSIIQDAINKTAALLEGCRAAGYDEPWLLVVGSAATSNAAGELASLYDRTFFLETFADELVELSTTCA